MKRWTVVLCLLISLGLMTLLTSRPGRAAGNTVTIAGYAYSPAVLTVQVGDSVNWSNTDPVSHTATSDSGAWDTGPIGGTQSSYGTTHAGTSPDIAFNTAGTFPYHCAFHPSMHGTIVVQGAATSVPTATLASPPTATSVSTPTNVPATATSTSIPTPTSAPTATTVPPALRITTRGTPRVGHSGPIRVIVRNGTDGGPVGQATVKLDGRKVGLKVLRRTTDGHGVALFKHIQPRKAGYILISASRLGYAQGARKVRVR